MKRNIIKVFTLLLILLAFSCDKYEGTYGFKPFVQVSTPTVNVGEKKGPTVDLTVDYVGPTLTQDLTINFDVTIDGPTTDIVSTVNSVVIPAGEFSATFTALTFNNNTVQDGNKVITYAISDLSSGSIDVATEGTGKSAAKVTIVDDDCPFDINDYVGSYSLTMTLANGFIYAAGTYELSATLSAGAGNTLVDPDFGYLAASGRDPVPVTIEIDPVAQSTVILGDPFTFLDGMTYDAVHAYNSAPSRRFFTNDNSAGPGEVATCDLTFTVNALIRREDGTIGQILTLTYMKE